MASQRKASMDTKKESTDEQTEKALQEKFEKCALARREALLALIIQHG